MKSIEKTATHKKHIQNASKNYHSALRSLVEGRENDDSHNKQKHFFIKSTICYSFCAPVAFLTNKLCCHSYLSIFYLSQPKWHQRWWTKCQTQIPNPLSGNAPESVSPTLFHDNVFSILPFLGQRVRGSVKMSSG